MNIHIYKLTAVSSLNPVHVKSFSLKDDLVPFLLLLEPPFALLEETSLPFSDIAIYLQLLAPVNPNPAVLLLSEPTIKILLLSALQLLLSHDTT